MKYLVSIYRPTGYEASVVEGPEMHAAIDAVNDEMVAKGIRVFVGGLKAPSMSLAIRTDADGKAIVTDGPYIETKEHIGGFWVLEASSQEEIIEWGRKASIACCAPVEIRPFFG